MQQRPDHPTLLDAIATFLMGDVAPKLEGDKALQFRVLIAANLATVVANEARTSATRAEAEHTRLVQLLGRDAPLDELNHALTERLRSGDAMTSETLEHLLKTARETLEVTNPRFELD